MLSEVYCIVSGKVQAVGYRDFVVRFAKEYEITGFVRNKKEGTVEILAQGMPDRLKEFVELLNQGSGLAKVDSVGAEWRTPEKELDDFEARF